MTHARPLPIRLLALFIPALLALSLGPARPAAAQPGFGGGDEVKVTAVPSVNAVAPGGEFLVAVIFDHADDWHIWPAEHVTLPEEIAGFAQRTTITLPEQLPPWIADIRGIQWPNAKPTPVANPMGGDPVAVPTYGGTAVAYIPITVARDAKPGAVTLDFSVYYQACDDSVCLPPESPELSITVRIDPAAAAPAINDTALFGGFDPAKVLTFEGGDASPTAPAATPTAADPAAAAAAPAATPGASIFGIQLGNSFFLLVLASIIGGAILNLTPCVLPVIPIKVMTLVQHAGGSHSRALTLGLWMALGVVAFWAAAGLPMALFSAALDPSRLIFGTWWVTLALGIIIAAMGLGIMGLFMINLPQSVYMVNPKADSPWGSFVFGVMTAVLGLPCFGFVAGGLLAGTAVLGPVKIMAIFVGLGVGMAAPYLVLSAKPGLVNKIPRTGPASELVKQVMGLLLIAAAAFFISAGLKALLSQKPYVSEAIGWWAVAFFVLLAALWLSLRTLQISKKPWSKIVMPALSAAAVLLAVSFANALTQTARQDYQRRIAAQQNAAAGTLVTGAWVPYTPALLEQALHSGKVVIADFTADWCILCKNLKAGVLDREPVRSRITQNDVVLIKVDLTSTSAPGWKFLADLGRSNIPTLAVFGPGTEKPLVYNAYTADTVLTAINQAANATPITATSPNPPTPTPSGTALGRSN